MIKLKNLWKIALTTMAMSAMLVACDTTDDGKKTNKVTDTTVYVEYPKEAKISDTGVYTAKLVKEGISTRDWGAGDGKETIKVVLAPKDIVAKIIDGSITSDAELFVDANKCYIYANNDVGNGLFTSATVKDGTYVQPAGFEKYIGLAITKDTDGNYIVKVDMTKIDTKLLLAKGAEEAKVIDVDNDPWNKISALKTEYIPMILGSVTANSGAAYPFNFWNAGIAIMEPSTEVYPAKITEEAVLSYTYKDIKFVVGTLTEWKFISLTEGKYEFQASDTSVRFKFTATEAWVFQAGSKDEITDTKETAHDYTAADMGKDIEIGGNTSNATSFTFPTEVGKTYTISFTATSETEATMKFEEKK